jgi:hypothetical protein
MKRGAAGSEYIPVAIVYASWILGYFGEIGSETLPMRFADMLYAEGRHLFIRLLIWDCVLHGGLDPY